MPIAKNKGNARKKSHNERRKKRKIEREMDGSATFTADDTYKPMGQYCNRETLKMPRLGVLHRIAAGKEQADSNGILYTRSIRKIASGLYKRFVCIAISRGFLPSFAQSKVYRQN